MSLEARSAPVIKSMHRASSLGLGAKWANGRMTTSVIIFHFIFPQDIAVLRPLVILAKSLPGKHPELLISNHLASSDPDGRFAAELTKLSSELNLTKTYYEAQPDVLRHAEGKSGLFIVGNESSVSSHYRTHDLFKALPSSFLKVTLQHGFECVGFLHNAAHTAAYGLDIRFTADVVVGWFAEERLTSMHPSARAKLYVAGPPIMVEPQAASPRSDGNQPTTGLVCENLHSVRFSSPGVYECFLEQFFAFAERMNAMGTRIDLRSHPAGRFADRIGLTLPSGVERNTLPLYEQDLGRFDFAISPPSSIVLDLLTANVPVAVWVDPSGRLDFSNFEGLETVSSAEEWCSFALRSSSERDAILAKQGQFLQTLRIPADVAGRYAQLMCRSP